MTLCCDACRSENVIINFEDINVVHEEYYYLPNLPPLTHSHFVMECLTCGYRETWKVKNPSYNDKRI